VVGDRSAEAEDDNEVGLPGITNWSASSSALVRLFTGPVNNLSLVTCRTRIVPMTKCRHSTSFLVCWIASNGPVYGDDSFVGPGTVLGLAGTERSHRAGNGSAS